MSNLKTRRFFTPSGIELLPLKPCIRMVDPERVVRESGLAFTREARDRIGCVWRCQVKGVGGVGLGRNPIEAYKMWDRIRPSKTDADRGA
jgi:hypothetical protein